MLFQLLITIFIGAIGYLSIGYCMNHCENTNEAIARAWKRGEIAFNIWTLFLIAVVISIFVG